jgi:hypothetical protein
MDFVITDLKQGRTEGHITGHFDDDNSQEYKFLRNGRGHVIAVSEGLDDGGFGILEEVEAATVIGKLNGADIVVSEECSASYADKMEAAANIKDFSDIINQTRAFMRGGGVTAVSDKSPTHMPIEHVPHPDYEGKQGFLKCRKAGIKILHNVNAWKGRIPDNLRDELINKQNTY